MIFNRQSGAKDNINMEKSISSSQSIKSHPRGPEGPQSAPTIVQREAHRLGSRLSEVILGGQDGLVNTMGVILGIAAATSEVRIIIAGGLAATFAESISMAAVAYTSTLADLDFYRAERAREMREIKEIPEMEKQEIRDIFGKWGFNGKLLEQIVDHFAKPGNENHWAEVMMAHELELQPIEPKGLLPTAGLVGFSAIVGSLIPLAPFFFMPVEYARWVALGLSAVALFAVGAIKARMTVGSPTRSGIQMMLIGILSALAGYAIGALFGAQPTG
jgi:VIT1/CCC1 family predicted Fe2+/Mn2+ transporter